MNHSNQETHQQFLNELYVNKSTVYRDVDIGYMTIPETIELPRIEPCAKWNKAKISYEVWAQVVSFMLWSQKEFGSEAHLTLFYNTATDTWAPWAFPQITNGMNVETDPTDKRYSIQRKKFPEPWVELGTVHHHCKSAAFQSGTDHQDEIDRDGIHITLGNMEANQLSVHCRASLDSRLYQTTLGQWVEPPKWIHEDTPEFILENLLEGAYLTSELFRDTEFPTQWAKNISQMREHKVSYAQGLLKKGHYRERDNPRTRQDHSGPFSKVLY